jgi:NTP pyrophosphatase (non-canonical NTP hydrolase)
MQRIRARLDTARREHPEFTPHAGGLFEALAIIVEEHGEVAAAANDDEGVSRVNNELLDLIATGIRALQEEYK